MQDILLTITGTNGLTSAIDYLTEGIIYFEATFKTVFAAISIPVTILQGEIYTLLTMMTDGVQAGKAAWAATADLFKEDVNTLKNSFSEAEEKITALRVARVKIREQQDDNATNESKNNQTSRKELNIKIEQLEKIIELQKDDLDVLGNIFEAQGKLLDISVELYKGELSDEDKLRKAHEDRLEKIKEIQFAQQQAYQQRTTDLEKALNEGQISEEDYMARRIEMRDEILEMYEQGNQARYFSEQKLQQDLVDLEKAAIDEIIEERKAMNQQLIDESMNLVNGISTAFLQIQDNATQQYIRNRDEAIENIEKMEKSGVISAEESARQRTDIENAYQQTIEKQMMKSFRMKQSAAVAGILIDMAQATARAMADYPFPASVGIAALAAGKAGLELAAVQSQPPPKFDVGGMVGQSDPLTPDQTQAQLLTGEAVLDRATVQRLGGEQGLRDLQNMPQQKVVVIQPFKHFDRFLSAGEKRGRFGTARASGRY